ncbi:MAG: acyl-phosphate glycerol 3-phosphate acyltransferase [Tenericutes bacterium]|nr:MAG: acyl-phosphate glycerol 3-phosphate acyltransferase [Mycoplasmatota bacterium]
MLTSLALPLSVLLGAYLIGSLSSAIILCKVAGLPDPRSQGSGNPGATNVLRFGGKKLAALVLGLDVLKGVIPVLIALSFSLPPPWVAGTAFFAFLGHLYPIFFQFKGGKGVATALGGLLAFSPLLAGLILLTWLVVFMVSKLSSLAAITAAALTPIYSFFLIDDSSSRIIVIVMAVMLLARHHTNIRRLLAGEEAKS